MSGININGSIIMIVNNEKLKSFDFIKKSFPNRTKHCKTQLKSKMIIFLKFLYFLPIIFLVFININKFRNACEFCVRPWEEG